MSVRVHPLPAAATAARRSRRRAPGPLARGSWSIDGGSTAELELRRRGHFVPVSSAPLAGRLDSDGAGMVLLCASFELGALAMQSEDHRRVVFRSRRILADADGRLTIPGTLSIESVLQEIAFHGTLLESEPGQGQSVIRAEATAELDRRALASLARMLRPDTANAPVRSRHGRIAVQLAAVAGR